MTNGTAAMSLFYHLSNKKSMHENPAPHTKPMHGSTNAQGRFGQQPAFGDSSEPMHKLDRWKNNMEERQINDGERRSRRTDGASGQYIIGTNSVADGRDRVGFSGVHVEGQTQLDGYHKVIQPRGTPDTIERSLMQKSDVSGSIESDSRKDLKRGIDRQTSDRGAQSIRIQLSSANDTEFYYLLLGCPQSRDPGYTSEIIGDADRRTELKEKSSTWKSSKGLSIFFDFCAMLGAS